ncbi:MAG: GAF domain-containing protein [Xenococcaceae cyanobacterium MO_167.B27]|nr:GAF domain-containing protein [Xenococcaceae cyanobacterium MO_167.B27]
MVLNWLFDSSDEQSKEAKDGNSKDGLLVTGQQNYLSTPSTINVEDLSHNNGKEQLMSVQKIHSEKTTDVETVEANPDKISASASVNLSLTANDLLRSINQEAQELMQDGVNKIRQSLKADRVLVYGFNPDGSGKVLAESVDSGWSRAGSSFDRDYFINENNAKPYYVVNDISTKNFARCFLESLKAIEAKAYINIPIKYNNELLGFLSAYQNSDIRNWQESEVKMMVNCAAQFRLPLQQTAFMRHSQFREEQREKAIKRERGLAQMLEQIRNATEEEKIFQIATQQGRKFLEVDRLAIYRFEPDWSGRFIAESVAAGWTKLIDTILVVQDTYLQETQGGRYKHGECFVVDDIYLVGHQPCHIQLLEQFEARAYMIAPIFSSNKKLWGLIAAYQNTGARKWQADEAESLRQLGLQVGIGMTNISSLKEIESQVKQQEKIAQQERAIAKLNQKIQQSQDLRDIFRSATNEVRQLLECDRVVVYQFKEDWSGEVLAESMSSGWVSVMQLQETDEELYSTEMNASSTCTLKYLESTSALDNDTYFKLNQGGDYSKGKKFQVVNDVYSAGFSPCYLQSLEKYQAKAYIIVPIFQNAKLWGLFAVYQNSGARKWEANELNLLLRIVPQLGIAIEQAELLAQIQTNNQELARRSERESAIIQFSSRLMTRFAGLMQKNSNPKTIMQFAINELRRVLEADRVTIYHFAPDWSGKFVVESVGAGWSKILGTELAQVKDSYIQQTQGGRYIRRESLQVNDIYQVEQNDFPIVLLEEWQTKAYLLVPIFKGEKLWGLLGIYQNDTPRQWDSSEQAIVEQVATNIGVTLQVGEYFTKLRSQEEQLSKLVKQERTQRESLQQGALQVLRALEPSFRGDLTVRAPLSEDEIGTIADGYNTTIQSMRRLVRQVQVSASRVSETSSVNSESVSQLSEQAQMQVQQLGQALKQLEFMVSSTQEVATYANKVEQTVEEANRTVQAGDSLMEKTVDEIMEIRDTVSDTAKKIKRLGETFQKISKVVSLIENFATQTNLLALNAAIEATRAGEYGKGFAVVADEVRSLAYHSADATTKISRLVEEIQTETNDVTEAMEVGIAQVVNGTTLVRETQQSLNAIVTATNDIKELVQEITQAAANQSQQSQLLTQVMLDVSTIASETSQDAAEISASFEELQNTSRELQTSVSQFKVD